MKYFNNRTQWQQQARELTSILQNLELNNDFDKKTIMYNTDCWVDHVREHGPKKVVGLITHADDYTGAPIALTYMASVLQKLGYYIIWITPEDGPNSKNLKSVNTTIIVHPLNKYEDLVQKFNNYINKVICNTILTYQYVMSFEKLGKKVIWWIHEAELNYTNGYKDFLPTVIPYNIKIYTVSEYAQEMLLKYRPAYQYQCDSLVYYLPNFMPDKSVEDALPKNLLENKYVFLCVGSIEFRKGQDILLDAIERLNPEILEQSMFIFVGKEIYKDIFIKLQTSIAKHKKSILYLSDVPITKMHAIYKQIDCYICPSRDDPLPIVVTEAMCASKLIICSKNTGSAPLLEEYNAGMVINPNVDALVKHIEYVVKNRNSKKFKKMRKNARAVYKKIFSKKVFYKNVKAIMKKY